MAGGWWVWVVVWCVVCVVGGGGSCPAPALTLSASCKLVALWGELLVGVAVFGLLGGSGGGVGGQLMARGTMTPNQHAGPTSEGRRLVPRFRPFPGVCPASWSGGHCASGQLMGLLAAAGAASNWTPASELLAAAGRRAQVEGRDPDPLVLEVCVVGLQVLFGGKIGRPRQPGPACASCSAKRRSSPWCRTCCTRRRACNRLGATSGSGSAGWRRPASPTY